ncbi:MAG: hypothetical protein M1830_001493 [Pleopsidium flavum]|nr:MAG: hypothetical protein M1830_001493 [Pleopsidium flavum]
MKVSLLARALGFASLVSAQTAKFCPPEGGQVCYSVNVPSNTPSSGTGDIFFQIQGPSSKQWIGLGQGGRMTGANIFIIYPDAGGKNVTLSPRLGKGNYQPNFDTDAKVTLLDGSGIANGIMTANVRCSNCDSWNGGSMDLKSSSSSWIWAVKDGSSLDTNDQSANLQQHSVQGAFKFDLTKASGGNSLNPFQDATATSTAAGGAAPTSAVSGANSGPNASSDGSSSSGSSSEGDDSGSSGGSKAMEHRMVIAHGVLMSLAFLIFFPLGALTIRLLSFAGTVWVHAGAQVFAYSMALAAFGIGIWIAVNTQQLNNAHPIIGITVLSLLTLQPLLGLTHHIHYVRTSRRTLWATAHVWLGRALITLGIINGGLGLQLSDNTRSGEIVYGVVAGIVALVYVAVLVVVGRKEKSEGGSRGEKGKGESSPAGSGDDRNGERGRIV